MSYTPAYMRACTDARLEHAAKSTCTEDPTRAPVNVGIHMQIDLDLSRLGEFHISLHSPLYASLLGEK